MSPLDTLLSGMTATPTLDKLEAFAADWREGEREEYVELLRTHDWSHEFSDDGMRYRQGREQLRRIRELQPRVDADGALFNAARLA